MVGKRVIEDDQRTHGSIGYAAIQLPAATTISLSKGEEQADSQMIGQVISSTLLVPQEKMARQAILDAAKSLDAKETILIAKWQVTGSDHIQIQSTRFAEAVQKAVLDLASTGIVGSGATSHLYTSHLVEMRLVTKFKFDIYFDVLDQMWQSGFIMENEELSPEARGENKASERILKLWSRLSRGTRLHLLDEFNDAINREYREHIFGSKRPNIATFNKWLKEQVEFDNTDEEKRFAANAVQYFIKKNDWALKVFDPKNNKMVECTFATGGYKAGRRYIVRECGGERNYIVTSVKFPEISAEPT